MPAPSLTAQGVRTRLFFGDGGWAVKHGAADWDIVVEINDAGTVRYGQEHVGWMEVAEHMATHGLAERLTGESSGSNTSGYYNEEME